MFNSRKGASMVFQNFVVLGIIPGTNIQINFQLWLGLVLSAYFAWQFRRLLHSKLLAAALLHRTFHKQRSIDLITL